MKLTMTNRRALLLYLFSAAILLTGLSGAVLIYLHASNVPDNALLDELEYSKGYQHDLELYGGKANVIASEIMKWFNGLWHGKSLAYVVACIALLISGCFFFAAKRLASDSKTGETGRHS